MVVKIRKNGRALCEDAMSNHLKINFKCIQWRTKKFVEGAKTAEEKANTLFLLIFLQIWRKFTT